SVERIAVIDHAGNECRALPGAARHASAVEDCLPPVGVADRLVEHEYGAKILEVGDAGKEGIGQEVVRRGAIGIAGILRSELPAWFGLERARAERDAGLGVGCQELGAHADQRGLGGGDLQTYSRHAPASDSFTRMRRCWGLLRNFTTYQQPSSTS